MKARVARILLVLSLATNVVFIPLLAWKLFGYKMMYGRNVDYVAELSYAVGYHRALGNDLSSKLDTYSARLPIVSVETNSVSALIWPAKSQFIVLRFSNPEICEAWIREQGDVFDQIHEPIEPK